MPAGSAGEAHDVEVALKCTRPKSRTHSGPSRLLRARKNPDLLTSASFIPNSLVPSVDALTLGKRKTRVVGLGVSVIRTFGTDLVVT